MSPEIKLIRLIEDYLEGNLPAEEKAAFEERLKNEPELNQEVELQRQLTEGIRRIGIKSKIKKGKRQFRIRKRLKLLSIVSLIITGITAALLLFQPNLLERNPYALPKYNEQGDTTWADADRYLPYQFFTIDPTQDTIIESKDGIVFSIPANAFVDKDGNPASGKVTLEVKDALNPADIIQGGLSTTSNGEPLETGGMFYLNARSKEKSLKVDDSKPILADVPTDKVKPGMMLFEGVRGPSYDHGEVSSAPPTINWINPVPIKTTPLRTVDLSSLNFYPPNYEDSLAAWGYDVTDTEFMDSLFYSFTCENNRTTDSVAFDIPSSGTEESYMDFGYSSEDEIITTVQYAGEEATSPSWSSDTLAHSECGGIDPAKIKTIRNQRFRNTYIATKAFEERLQLIYKTCDNELLDLYISNLELPLYKVDSMAAMIAGRYQLEFDAFVSQRFGSVDVSSKAARKLNKFYETKSKAHAIAAARTNRKYWNKQSKLDRKATKKRNKYDARAAERENEAFHKEYNYNLKEAYRQLGKPVPKNSNPRSGAVYNVQIRTTGWKNIDRFVAESTAKRETLDYNNEEGNSARIEYEQVSISVVNEIKYDRIYVYLINKPLASYKCFGRYDGPIAWNLNMLTDYSLICVGYIDNEPYFASERSLKPQSYSFQLTKTDKAGLNQIIRSMSTNQSSMEILGDLKAKRFFLRDKLRRSKNVKLRELKEKTEPIIFPCNRAVVRGDPYYGSLLLKDKCNSCHSMNSDLTGPALAGSVARWKAAGEYKGISGREWMKRWIVNWQDPVDAGYPYAVEMQNYNGSAMNSFTTLKDEEINSLIAYLEGWSPASLPSESNAINGITFNNGLQLSGLAVFARVLVFVVIGLLILIAIRVKSP